MTEAERHELADAIVNEIERRTGALRAAIDEARLALVDADSALCQALSDLGITIRSASVARFPSRPVP